MLAFPFLQLKLILLVLLKYFAMMALVEKLALNPLAELFFVLKLMIPELPDASYFAGS